MLFLYLFKIIIILKSVSYLFWIPKGYILCIEHVSFWLTETM